MNVSLKWLSEYVDISGHTAEDLAGLLTRGGIEVDAAESRNRGVSGVVVGHVVEREKHPDADRLSVCKVDAGTGELLTIVCGAPNVAAGQKVPVALIGAVLPGDFKIKKAKLRGVESQGMICSAKELGLNDKLLPKEIQEGILVLPESSVIGEPIERVLDLDDAVLELDLTPNRSDALSMIGVACEMGALLGRPVRLPEADVARYEDAGLKPVNERFPITIAAPEACGRYAGRVIEGVRIAPSPLWLQNRLMAAGIRPINNVVDVTNYVMLEYGQPLHAFDADRLAGGRIEVRFARPGEKLVTLDDQERELDPDMLLITDGRVPVALAGVMGGANSEVSADTRTIFLESANFSGKSVRRTSRRLGLRSEASLRFEKEADPAAVIPALNRAAALIAELAGGRIAPGISEATASVREPAAVQVTLEKTNRLLGTNLSADEVGAIFERLSFHYEREGDRFRVTVPTRRGDISRDVDLIEEVARLHGYDNIPTTLMEGDVTTGGLTKSQAIRREVRRLLSLSGMHEVITYSLTGPDRCETFNRLEPGAVPIRVAMPMSEERSVLRTTLLPNLLDAAAFNRNRSEHDLALFEIGSVYLHGGGKLEQLPAEKTRLALLLGGNRVVHSWTDRGRPADFFDLKGLVERMAAQLGLPELVWTPAQPNGLHPGRSADIWLESHNGERQLVGFAGQLHPSLQAELDLGDTFVAELDLERIIEAADFAVRFRALPRHPAVDRDIAVVVDRSLASSALVKAVREAAGETLEKVHVFDVYEGERLGTGKKSVALSLRFRHPDRTLTDGEIADVHERIVAALVEQFAAELRK
jgi:phenylalanyl-tRNA synthetase beta chain